MSLTYGFYNSLNGDRTYNAEQMSQIFDGIITDGIFSDVGDYFAVKANGEDNNVTVGSGRAWFNSTWTYNDTDLIVEAEEAEQVLDRIDMVILEVNSSADVRENSIKILTGTPASSDPEAPELEDSEYVHQYPLAEIYREAGSTYIRQADITNHIGGDDTPFVTGILETVSMDTLLGQWQDALDKFVEEEEADYAAWYASMKEALISWTTSEEGTFLDWFESIKGQLSEDAAGNLQNEIDKAEIERILISGMLDGEKSFSDDGSVITTVDSSGRTLVKTFNEDFSKCESVLTSAQGSVLATMVKEFADDGSTISTTVDIV